MMEKKLIKKTLKVGIFILLFLFFGCVSIPTQKNYRSEVLPVEELMPEELDWSYLTGLEQNDSLSYCEYIVKSEKIKWICVKVDLQGSWKIVAEPTLENLGKSFSLNEFSQKYGTLVSINTVPFKKEKQSFYPISIVKNDGQIVCPANERYCALGLKTVLMEQKEDKKSQILQAKIIKNQDEKTIEEFDYVFGGYFVILENNKVLEYAKYRTSRSAVGISEDGRYLYFFAVCGINNPSGNRGMNYEECALVLQKLGCYSAMEFDGGHSTGLMLQNKQMIKPAFQTKVPAAFGLYIP